MRDNLMINQNTDDEAQKILDALEDGVAKEETAQQILSKSQETMLKVNGLINVGSNLTVTPSDNVLVTVLSTVATKGQTVGSVHFNKVGGTVRITASVKMTGTGSAGVYVIKNGNYSYIQTTSDTYETKYIDIAVSAGDTLTFGIINATGSYANMITVGGDLSEPGLDLPNISLV